MKQINVEEIMEEIRQEIKDKGYTPDMLSFRDVNSSYVQIREFNSDEFKNTVGFIEASKYVPWKIENPGSGLKGTLKRMIQRVVGPIIGPLSDKQNNYNQQVAEAFSELLGYVEQQNSLMKEYEKKIELLHGSSEETEKQ